MTTPQEDNSLDEATQSEDEACPAVESREILGKEAVKGPPESDDDEDTDLDDDGLLIQEAEERVETGNRPGEEEEDDDEELPPLPKRKIELQSELLPKAKARRMSSDGAPRAAARRPGVTLKRLVDEGFLVPGIGVFRCEYKGMVSVGELTQDGRISWEGLMFDSPSAWSIHLKRLVTPNRKADDGWKTIKYEGKFLEHFKLALAQRVLGSGGPGEEDKGGASLKGGIAAPEKDKGVALKDSNALPQGGKVETSKDSITAPQEDKGDALKGSITAPQENKVETSKGGNAPPQWGILEALKDSDAPPQGDRVVAESGSNTAPAKDKFGALNDGITAPQEAKAGALNGSDTALHEEAKVTDDRSGAAEQGGALLQHGGHPLNIGNGSMHPDDKSGAFIISSTSAGQQGCASVEALGSNNSSAAQEENKVSLLDNSSGVVGGGIIDEQCKASFLMSGSSMVPQDRSLVDGIMMSGSTVARQGNGSGEQH